MLKGEAVAVGIRGDIVSREAGLERWVETAKPAVDVRAYVYVALMILLGSTTAAAAKLVVREFPIAWLPVLRFTVAGFCVLPFAGGRAVMARVLREDWRLLLVAAVLCIPINQAFFLNAARLGPTSHVGLFYATVPLVVLLLAWTMRLERPDTGRLWGVLTSVAGVAVIGLGNAWSGNGEPAAAETVRSVVLADCLLVGAVLSWGAYVTVSKPLIMRHGAMPALAATFIVGSLLEIPVAACASWPELGGISTNSWLALLVLAVFITPVNLACQNLALKRLDASEVANFSNVAPVLTVVWGVCLFGEAVTPTLVLGGALALVGIMWACRPSRENGRQAVGVARACRVG